ncbi:MAG: hypothetical protein LBJ59_08485, partial [Zoogloeaceae bacterium]|nr:hypothetical protein [Zoogloeaceae bacterium]
LSHLLERRVVKSSTVCFSFTFHTHSLSHDYTFEKVSITESEANAFEPSYVNKSANTKTSEDNNILNFICLIATKLAPCNVLNKPEGTGIPNAFMFSEK